MKRVAVQENLTKIKEELKQRGYEVVGFNDSGFIDAVIYVDDTSGFKNINDSKEINNSGTVIINAKNRSIEDLEYIIQTRRYEKLF